MTQDRFEPTPENQWPAEPSDEQQLDPRASPTAPAAREAEPPTPPGRQVTGDPPGPSATGAAASEDSRQGLVSIDDFARIDLRVAVVLAVERVEGTDRLLQLTIDLGSEQRTIVSGIAHVYPPEALVGRRIVVVANLQPARIRGVESRGMLLAAGGRKPGEELGLITLDKEIPAGTRVS
jgi:methionyl-tRNA synthetase